jgi:hypothetical protein
MRVPWLALLLVRQRRGPRTGEIEADLRELFDVRASEHGSRYARRKYWADAVSLWRPGVRRVAARRAILDAPPSPRDWSLDTMWNDILFAARLFRRQPGTLAITVAGLALAIAVATAVVSVLNAALFRPPGVAEPDRAVTVWRTWQGGASGIWPYGDYVQAREAVRNSKLESWIREAASFSLTPDAPRSGACSLQTTTVRARRRSPCSATRSGAIASARIHLFSAGRFISSAIQSRSSASRIAPSRDQSKWRPRSGSL